MESTNHILKMLVPPYLTIKPLIWTLGELAPEIKITESIPREITGEIAKQRIDIALAPLLTVLRRPRLSIIPDISISTHGPSKNCILFSKTAPADIKTVLLDRSSINTIALLRAIFRIRWSMQPVEVLSAKPLTAEYPFHDMDYDAFLIIGDEAMRTSGDFEYILDMGEQWEQWTHLALVHMVWVVREGIMGPALDELLVQARDTGLLKRDEIAREFAGKIGIPEEESQELLKITHYELGEGEFGGIERFHAYMKDLKICPPEVELRIYRGDRIETRVLGKG